MQSEKLKTQKAIPDPPSPVPVPVAVFDNPRLYFSPAERRFARVALGAIAYFFLAVTAALLYFGFPRGTVALDTLFTPEFALGLLLVLFFAHLWLEQQEGAASLVTFRRGGKPAPKNIAPYFHPETFSILEDVVETMRGRDTDALIPTMLKTAVEHPRLQKALGYLEVDAVAFGKDLENLRGLLDDTFEVEKLFTPRSDLFQRLAREAVLEALNLGHAYVMPEDVVLALLDEEIPALKTFLARWNIRQDELRGISGALDRSRWRFSRRRSRTIAHRVMNRAWTARPTYTLDRYARDLTDLAREGYVGHLVGHQSEVGVILRVLNRATKNNILLVGEAGSGKMTILEHIAWLISHEEVPPKLFDKRLAVLDVGLLVAGSKNVGELQERVVQVMDDIIRAGNIILAITDIHTMLTVGKGEGVSISTVLGPVFSQGAFQVVGLTDPKSYHTIIEQNADFQNHFEVVAVEEISADEALKTLVARARALEETERITISFPALKKAVELADRYIHDKRFPAKALDLVGEGVEYVKRLKRRMLTDEDIAALISERTGIPVTQITKGEAETLLNLGEEIHKRIIDQEEAVNAIADVIRQSRAGVRRENAPVGSFLFVGPTGVGKTECAKALAEIYFKSEESMVRLDMSEYQTRESVYRLLGAPDGTEPGQLTERMKHNPYSLVLLDEFEKAHANVLDLFLQVLDDGRITDATGNTVDMTNAVIIATSNAHSVFVLESLKAGKSTANIAQELKDKLTAYFKPELLNRFDEIIVFKPLSSQDIGRIARLQLKQLFAQLEKDRGVTLAVTDATVVQLAELGYHPEFGARPLRHVLRKKIRDLVAEEILKNKLVRGDSAVIDAKDGEFALVKAA